MYTSQVPAKACVRLLNTTGPLGCTSLAGTLTAGPLYFVQSRPAGGGGSVCRLPDAGRSSLAMLNLTFGRMVQAR